MHLFEYRSFSFADILEFPGSTRLLIRTPCNYGGASRAPALPSFPLEELAQPHAFWKI